MMDETMMSYVDELILHYITCSYFSFCSKPSKRPEIYMKFTSVPYILYAQQLKTQKCRLGGKSRREIHRKTFMEFNEN